MTPQDKQLPLNYLEVKKFEEALAKSWESYCDSGSATVDALEDNPQELAYAKGFYAAMKLYKKDAEWLEKACEWLRDNLPNWVDSYKEVTIIEDFRKAMEE